MCSNCCCIACNIKEDSSLPSLFDASPLEDILLKLQRNVSNNSSQHSLSCLHSNYVTHTRVSLLDWLSLNISLTLSCLFPLVVSPFQFFIKLINLNMKFKLQYLNQYQRQENITETMNQRKRIKETIFWFERT